MVVSPPPWGSSAMGFLRGEGLPYGIPSGGTFAIWYNFPGGGGGGGGFRGEEFPCDTGLLTQTRTYPLINIMLHNI